MFGTTSTKLDDQWLYECLLIELYTAVRELVRDLSGGAREKTQQVVSSCSCLLQCAACIASTVLESTSTVPGHQWLCDHLLLELYAMVHRVSGQHNAGGRRMV